MSSLFLPFSLFDLFRTQHGRGSDAPHVTVDAETGMFTFLCVQSDAPRVSVDAEHGMLSWDYSGVDDVPPNAYVTLDGIPYITQDGNYYTTVN